MTFRLALLALLFVPASALAAQAPKESPFACVMSALSSAERKQHFEEYGPKLRARLTKIQELPDGYEFGFAPDPETYRMLSTWMFQERLCCPFFDLDLRIDREGGPLWLRLTGREGVKEFITAEFDPWFQGRGR
jgi:hypothetical protein